MLVPKGNGGLGDRKPAVAPFVANGFMKAVSLRCISRFRGSSKSDRFGVTEGGREGKREHYATVSGTNERSNSTPFPSEV